MKESYIYIGAPVLAAALRRVKPVISRQCFTPIMQNVIITRRAVIAGDLDAWFMTEIDAGGYGAFRVAVEPAPLLKALKGVKGIVTLHNRGGTVLISTDNATLPVPAADPGDYPLVPSVGDYAGYFTPAGMAVLYDAATIASRDNRRPSLQSVKVESTGAHVYTTATDSYRAYMRRAEGAINKTDNPLLVPAPYLLKLKGAKLGVKADTQVYISESHIHFIGAGFAAALRLIDGKYPDVGKFFTDTNNYNFVATLDRAALAGALEPIAGAGETVRLVFNGSFTILHKTDALTLADIPAETTGEFTSAVDPVLLKGLIDVMRGEIITMKGEPAKEGERSLKALLIRDNSTDAIIMPVRL